MKIIGNTVGMGLPKPNLMQADATKGDYIYGKEEFLANLTTENITAALGYTPAREEEVSQLAGEIDNAKAFMVEYGVTEYGEIEAAYNAGRMLYCKRGDDLYPFSHFKTTAAGNVTTYYAVFCGNAGLSLSELSCSDASVWSVAVKQLISTGVLDQAVNSSASNASAPSTKAVYNATKDAVKTTRQTLTDEQKAQARTNIGAVDAESVIQVFEEKVTRPATAEVGQVIAVKAVDANGKPTEWEAVDMAGGGGVQSDWNQTDDTAADFIKNKPFGDEVVEILPTSDVPFVFDADTGGPVAVIENGVSLSVGDTLGVTWDGTEYNCVIIELSDIAVFGNSAAFGMVDSGEPFVGTVDDGALVIIDLTAQADVVRSIAISKVSITKMPTVFLPGAVTIFYINGSDKYLYSDFGCTTKVTAKELTAAISAGVVTLYSSFGMMFTTCAAGINPSGYGLLQIVEFALDDSILNHTFYTAEYTPET